MDQGAGDSPDELDGSPAAIRASMAQTRDELARHLAALKDRLFHPSLADAPGAERAMATKKTGRRAVSSSAGESSGSDRAQHTTSKSGESSAAPKVSAPKAGPKTKAAAPKKSSTQASGGVQARKKGASASPRKSRTPKGQEKGIVQKTGEVLDTVLAGAVVGAITGAARNLAHEPTAVPASGTLELRSAPGAKQESPTTGEVLSELASGAAVGAVAGAAKSILPPDEEVRPVKVKKTSKKK